MGFPCQYQQEESHCCQLQGYVPQIRLDGGDVWQFTVDNLDRGVELYEPMQLAPLALLDDIEMPHPTMIEIPTFLLSVIGVRL